jgi:hypothetical protein
MPIDSHLPQADPFSLVPTFKFNKLQVTEVGWSFSLLKYFFFFKGIYTSDRAKAMLVYVYGCVYDLAEFPIVK